MIAPTFAFTLRSFAPRVEENLMTELPIEAKQAAKMIMAGRAPRGLKVNGHLNLRNNPTLSHLPEGLQAPSLDVSGCTGLRALPADLRVRRLNISGCMGLQELPPGLGVYELEARDLTLRVLPSGLRVELRLDLSGCAKLEELPRNLKVGSLNVANCTRLESLPEGLDVCFLNASNCLGLRAWPKQATVRIGTLNLSGCANLRSLPSWLTSVSQLDLHGCTNLAELPDTLRVSSWVDIANTGIESLPPSLKGVGLRWRGVPIDARIAFSPHEISARETLDEPNAERRRVLLERMGYERFLSEARAHELDRDRDAGGERRLLRVPIPNDEPLVCLAVFCPSTGRQYMLRVPPATRTCRHAAAWIAGFDNADDYAPIAET